MKKKSFSSERAPAAIGPYSQGVRFGDFVFLSGQIGVNPDTKRLVEGGVEAQARQIFSNIKAVLNEVGLDLDHVVKTTVFLKSMDDFKRVNDVYAGFFQPPYPARSAVAVKELPLSVDIEIEVVAGI